MTKLTNFCKSIIISLAIICSFSLLFCDTLSIFPLVLPKTILFRILVEIMLIFYLILIFYQKEFLPKWTKLNIALVIFVFINIVSSLAGVNPYRSFFSSAERMNGLFGLIHYFLFILILSSVIKTKNE